jgi:hypothetical protein
MADCRLSASFMVLAVFSSEVGSTELDLRAAVFLPEHCSAFCFLCKKLSKK